MKYITEGGTLIKKLLLAQQTKDLYSDEYQFLQDVDNKNKPIQTIQKYKLH